MRKSLLTVAFGLAMLSLSAAHAQGAQGYVGGGLGWTSIDVDCTELDVKCDKSSTGGKLYGGYRFASQFAVEGVYINWGKATGSFKDDLVASRGRAVPMLTPSPPSTRTIDVELKASGLGIGVAYFMPFGTNWNGVARLGAMRNDGKLKFTGTGTFSKKATFAYFGLGVGYQITPNLVATGEADFSRVKYGLEGEYETDNVRLLSIGLRYSF